MVFRNSKNIIFSEKIEVNVVSYKVFVSDQKVGRILKLVPLRNVWCGTFIVAP